MDNSTPRKFIDYEITGEKLVFIADDGTRKQVEKGTIEAEQLFETVVMNRNLAGLNGDEAQATAQAKAAQKNATAASAIVSADSETKTDETDTDSETNSDETKTDADSNATAASGSNETSDSEGEKSSEGGQE